jgi:hypothetical protein
MHKGRNELYGFQDPKLEIPREIEDKPELHLVWRGLQISLSAGQMTRREAYEMLHRWDQDEPLPPAA